VRVASLSCIWSHPAGQARGSWAWPALIPCPPGVSSTVTTQSPGALPWTHKTLQEHLPSWHSSRQPLPRKAVRRAMWLSQGSSRPRQGLQNGPSAVQCAFQPLQTHEIITEVSFDILCICLMCVLVRTYTWTETSSRHYLRTMSSLQLNQDIVQRHEARKVVATRLGCLCECILCLCTCGCTCPPPPPPHLSARACNTI
jgi:hypothetical protein